MTVSNVGCRGVRDTELRMVEEARAMEADEDGKEERTRRRKILYWVRHGNRDSSIIVTRLVSFVRPDFALQARVTPARKKAQLNEEIPLACSPETPCSDCFERQQASLSPFDGLELAKSGDAGIARRRRPDALQEPKDNEA